MSDDIDYEKLAEQMIAKLRGMGLSRREMLIGLTGAGAAGLGVASVAGRAQAQTISGVIKADQLGTSSEPVQELYVQNQTNYSESESFDDITVNNTATVGALDTDDLRSAPHQIRLEKTSTQSIASGTVTTITWDSIESQTNSDVDLSNWVDIGYNGFTVPSASPYDELRIRVSVGLDGGDVNLFTTRKNGGYFYGGQSQLDTKSSVSAYSLGQTGWVDAIAGDHFTADIKGPNGLTVDTTVLSHFSLEVR